MNRLDGIAVWLCFRAKSEPCNSGLEGFVCDICAVIAAFPGDFFYGLVGSVASFGDCFAQCCHAEDAPAVVYQLTAFHRRAGVEDLDVLQRVGVFNAP